ncbi:ATP-binding protein [Actinokineospora diospyrosa]|uniref:ABC transporter n=1 Tax=Actinokineospora diospyrosa TaxID=103728 RepID=A0ABT1IJ31_9PSEU|nr:ATP-binding protein [Actinokineospora diospyrosa]MCP2272662.1 ABC transporter [Actinokineospora diospyrosa]
MLRHLIDSEELIPLECTGFAFTEDLPESVPEGRGRVQGLLTFDQAVAAGQEQLERPFVFALDIATAWYELGIAPHQIPGRLSVSLGGGLVLDVTDDRRSPTTLRPWPRPVHPQVPRPTTMHGRTDESLAVRMNIAPGKHIMIAGEPGAGRTTLLRTLAHEDWTTEFPDGVIHLDGGGIHPDDLGQAVLDALYLTDEPVLVDAELLSDLLGDARVLVFVDDADAHKPAVLTKAMPRSAVVAAMTTADEPAVVLGGLSDTAAVSVLSNGGESTDALRRIAAALAGHPGDLTIAASLLDQGTFTPDALAAWLTGGTAARSSLVAALVRSLAPEAREVLSQLAAVPTPMTRQHVSGTVGHRQAELGLNALRRAGLLDTTGAHVRLLPSLSRLVQTVIPAGQFQARMVDHLAEWVDEHGSDTESVLADAALLEHAAREALRQDRPAVVEKLARALSPALAAAGRWGARGAVLGVAVEAGRMLADTVLQLWATGQLTARPHSPEPATSSPGQAAGHGTHVVGWKALAVAAVAVTGVSTVWFVANGTPDRPTMDAATSSTYIEPTEPVPTVTEGTTSSAPLDPTTTGATKPTESGTSSRPVFDQRTQDLGTTVLARGFMIQVESARTFLSGGQPTLEVRTEVQNQLWGEASSSPPAAQVRYGNAVDGGGTNKSASFPRGTAVPVVYTFFVREDFSWAEATLEFLVSNHAAPSTVSLSGQRPSVPHGPLPVTLSKQSLESGRLHLTFRYNSLFRLDAALYAEGSHDQAQGGGSDFDRPWAGGLDRGKGSLKIYFDLTGAPGRGGLGLGTENFTLTRHQDGRTLRFDSTANVALYPDAPTRTRLAIATQLDLPATGTYTLTFLDRNYYETLKPEPDSLTFTIG